MFSALLNGTLGTLACLFVGTHYLGFDWIGSLECALVANIVGFVALLITIQVERLPWVKKHILTGGFRTWTLLLILYFGGNVALVERLRDFHAILLMAAPIVWSSGFCILPFGFVQDRLVAAAQRRERENEENPAAAAR